MQEREYIEHTKWDLDSIVDAAIDASVEILRVEGAVGQETLRRVGQEFAGVSKNPFEPLTIVAPEGTIALVTFVPPLEFGVNGYDLDDGEESSEARLLVFNPLVGSDVPVYRKRQMSVILEDRLRAVSHSYMLKQEELKLTFPKEFYSIKTNYYNVPIL